MKSETGYSLTELMVVIAVLGIVTAFAVPAINHYAANSNLKTAARDIASDIYALRERAVSENRQYLIEFTSGNNSYTLYQGTYSGEPWTAVQAKSLLAAAKDIRFTEVSFDDQKISFSTRGLARNGHVSVANRYNSTATITVNITGKTYVRFNMQ